MAGACACVGRRLELDVPTITAFLDHLEVDRHIGARTRNARLVGVLSLFDDVSLRNPDAESGHVGHYSPTFRASAR